MESRTTSKIGSSLPYILLILAGAGFGLTLLLKRPDLSLFSLVLVVPMLLAAVFLFANKEKGIPDLPDIKKIRLSYLVTANIIILALSVVLLVSQTTRSPLYFVLISLSAGVILMQIISNRSERTNGLILIQVMLLSLDLIWGVTLKYPLYFGDTDLLIHMDLINTILKTGHTDTSYIYYQQYPLYHELTAIGVQVTGESIRNVLFVMMGLTWQIGIAFAYLIFKDISKSTRFALIACLLFALSAQVIFYGSYSIARSLAFVFLMCWLYLVVGKAPKDSRFFFLSLIVLAAMVMTHHLNVLYTIPVLFIVYFVQMLINRSRQEKLLKIPFVYLLSIASVGYFFWVATGLSNSSFSSAIRDLINMEGGFKGISDLTKGFGIPVVFGTIYYSFVLLLGLIGTRVVLKHLKFSGPRQTSGLFAIAGLVLLVVYIPGFLYLFPLSDILLTDRVSLIVTGFVAFLMTYGLLDLFHIKSDNAKPAHNGVFSFALPVLLIIVTTFFSSISIGNAKDTNYFPHTVDVDSPYFTNSEMKSFSFVTQRADLSLTLFTDYATERNAYSFGMETTRTIIRNVSDMHGGYAILRIDELLRKQSLGFYPVDGPEYPIRYPINKLQPELDNLNQSSAAQKIYGDGAVQIYMCK